MKAHDRTTRPARIPLAIALTLQLLYVSGVTRPKRAIDFAAAMRPATSSRALSRGSRPRRST
jgi:hypothetical protein